MVRFGFQIGRDPRLRHDFFGQNELDRKIKTYLDFDDGFFIEAGANDGVSQSNTLHFERHCGWQGLLVEPVPALARRCRAARPRSLTVNAALGNMAQRGSRLNMTFCNLMSAVDGAMPNVDELNSHIALGAQVQNIKPYRLSVLCVPLSDLIDRYSIGRIDLLSLDLEGYEAAALAGIDFSRHRPRLILIEARYRKQVDSVIGQHYEPIAEFGEFDVLYRARMELPLDYAAGWNYRIERGLTNLASLGGIFVN